jgi:hypothetical protein
MMDKRDLAVVSVEAVNGLVMVVRNIEETVKCYWELFGIGPWVI